LNNPTNIIEQIGYKIILFIYFAKRTYQFVKTDNFFTTAFG